MTIRLQNIILGLDDGDAELRAAAAEKLGVRESEITFLEVVRRSVDPRGGVRFVHTVDVALGNPEAEADAVAKGAAVSAEQPAPVQVDSGSEPIRGRAVVVGAGPAGLFAAWLLAERGYRPLILERGASAPERHADTQRFLATRELNPESNFVFGAGGAGAYSDGKLHTRIRDPRTRMVLDRVIALGGPADLAIDGRPHVGTDILREVVAALCRQLEEKGAEFRWRTRLTGLESKDKGVVAARTASERIETNCVVLAAGANARDTFVMLRDSGIELAPKPFQMGLRIEHPREWMDRAIYGSRAGHPRLGAADYALSAAGVTTFCVCPGGVLVPACSEPESLCTNGMSYRARDSAFTNGALVSTVLPAQSGANALDGLDYQRRWERAAYMAGGGNFSAPAQRASDFLKGRLGPLGRDTSFPFGIRPAMLETLLPTAVGAAIAEALQAFDRRLRGYAGDAAVLVGPETRASCPVRIPRDPGRMTSVSLDGVYPVGEGSGYAGGIMSSAVDGLRAAEAVIARFAPPRD